MVQDYQSTKLQEYKSTIVPQEYISKIIQGWKSTKLYY